MPFKLKGYAGVLYLVINSLFQEHSPNSRVDKIRDKFIDEVIESLEAYSLERSDVEKMISCIDSVKLTPVLQDRDALSTAIGIAGNGRARNILQKMFLATFGFSRRFIKQILDDQQYGYDAELAAIENSMFETTREVVFGLDKIILRTWMRISTRLALSSMHYHKAQTPFKLTTMF